MVKAFRVLLLGDFLLDAYTTGKVRRISPEGPVPILEVVKQESRAGGAGNVALNISAIGGSVDVIGRRGDDASGLLLQKELENGKVETDGLFIQKNYHTPIKTRLIAGSQQLLRVDQENIEAIPFDVEEEVIRIFEKKIDQTDVIAISDYGKGFLTNAVLSHVIKRGKEKQIPVIVDPKGIDFTKYNGATLIKPNLQEAYGAAKKEASVSIDEVATAIFQNVSMDFLLITRSEEGMSLFNTKKNRSDFPIRSKEVRDVTGAGDTALAMICRGFGMKMNLSEAINLANIAAGIAVEKVGCAQVSIKDIEARLAELS